VIIRTLLLRARSGKDSPDCRFHAKADISGSTPRRAEADGLPVYDAVNTNITGGLRAEIDSSLAR
jgi:hypothetical protein